MKKTLFFAAAAICAAALAVSCENMEVVTDVHHDYRIVTVELPDSGTKLDINEGGKVSWESGDKISIQGKEIDEVIVVELTADDISDDGRSATIQFDAQKIQAYGNHDYYAAYPAEAVNFFRGEALHYIQFDKTNLPLMAAYLDKETNIFKFINVCGAISFSVSTAFDSYVFSGNKEEAVGYSQFAVKRVDGDTYAKARVGELQEISGGVLSNGSLNYIFLPWGTDFKAGFSLKFKNGDTIVKEVKTATPVNVSYGKLLALGDITGRLIDYVPEAHHSSITNAVNLGASETANCYVITEPGSYKIPVVKGNSDVSAGERAKTKLVWETYNSTESVTANSVIAEVDYDEDDNFVYFKTPDELVPGNALIAAVDVNGDIIWSWHIWIPASSIETIGDYKASKKYIMDRNLGALTGLAGESGKNYGMLYQWGRKDPKVGLDGTGTKHYVKTAPSDAFSVINTTDGEKTILDAIQNPTVTFTNNHCWYDSANVEEELWATTKTIYDPCPAGWMVPPRDIINTSIAEEDAVNGGVNVSSLYFPGTGSLSRYGGTWVEGNCFCWTCETKADSEQKAYWYLFKDYKADGGTNGFGSYDYKTTTAPVRCIKIEGDVPEPEPEAEPQPEITIDGDMSDWANVTGAVTPNNVCREMKVAYNANFFYFYLKCIPGGRGNQLWGENAGYYYIDFDLDNDPATGDYTEGDRGKLEAFLYLYLFGGTAESPVIVENPAGSGSGVSIENIVAKGVVTSELIEIELSLPRANLPEIAAGQTIRVISWRSKDGTVIEHSLKVQ